MRRNGAFEADDVAIAALDDMGAHEDFEFGRPRFSRGSYRWPDTRWRRD
jgi:hypothetical protein